MKSEPYPVEQRSSVTVFLTSPEPSPAEPDFYAGFKRTRRQSCNPSCDSTETCEGCCGSAGALFGHEVCSGNGDCCLSLSAGSAANNYFVCCAQPPPPPTTVEPTACGCSDSSDTGFVIRDYPASCSQLANYCSHSEHGTGVTCSCPDTCNRAGCPTPPPTRQQTESKSVNDTLQCTVFYTFGPSLMRLWSVQFANHGYRGLYAWTHLRLACDHFHFYLMHALISMLCKSHLSHDVNRVRER